MQYLVTRSEKGKIEVKVEVAKAELVATYNQILSQLGNETKIAGFRPGKAPANVVEQYVGLAKLLNETASFLISKHLDDILKKENLIPLDSPKIAIDSLSKDSLFSFKASFTQKPKVTIGNWKKIRVKKLKPKEVADEDVTKSIKNIFEAYQKQKTKGTEGSEGTDGIEEAKGKFIYDAHGNKVFFEDKGDPPLHKASKGDSPGGITDEFARAIGARDVAHLREIVRKDLENILADQINIKFEEEICEKIGEIGAVEVPEILIEDELSRILIRLNSHLEQQGKKLEDYLREQKTTVEELKNKWREQAAKNVKTNLLLDEIGKEEKVTVTSEEVEAALKNISQTNLTAEQKEEVERYIAISLFKAKTLDLVKITVAA